MPGSCAQSFATITACTQRGVFRCFGLQYEKEKENQAAVCISVLLT